MDVLVTGGSGFVGAHLVPLLVEDSGIGRVVVVDNATAGSVPDALEGLAAAHRVEIVTGDVTDTHHLAETMREVDAVVHLAACTSVDHSIVAPQDAVANNVLGMVSLIEAARRTRPRRILHVSTDEVFGPISAPRRANESTPFAPTNPYAASKAACDHLAQAANCTYRLGITTVHFTNLYGPWQLPGKLVPTAIERRLRGEPVPIHGQGSCVREYTYVADAAHALVLALRRGTPGDSYLVGSGTRLTTLDVVHHVNDLVGGSDETYQLVADRPGRPCPPVAQP